MTTTVQQRTHVFNLSDPGVGMGPMLGGGGGAAAAVAMLTGGGGQGGHVSPTMHNGLAGGNGMMLPPAGERAARTTLRGCGEVHRAFR